MFEKFSLTIMLCALAFLSSSGDVLRLVEEMQGAELRQETGKYRAKVYRFGEGGNAFRCILFPPSGNVASKKRVPMIVHIPGNGERGEPIKQFRQRTIFDKVLSAKFQKSMPCYLLAISPPESVSTLHGGMPGQPNGVQRTMHDMICAAADVAKNPAVDRNRIYLTGFSYGGSGVYALALHYPGEYAAAMPISSLPPLPEYFCESCPGSFWHFYNEGDYFKQGIKPKDVETFRDMVNSAGGDFRIGSYAEEGHDAWTSAWHEDEAWKWMFSKDLGNTQLAGFALAGAKCSASVSGKDVGCGPERAIDGLDSTFYEPKGGFSCGDWWMVELSKPMAGRVVLYSGDEKGGSRLSNAVVEVSANGKNWKRAGAFLKKAGTCSFNQAGKFRFIRVRAQSSSGEFRLRRVAVTRSK